MGDSESPWRTPRLNENGSDLNDFVETTDYVCSDTDTLNNSE